MASFVVMEPPVRAAAADAAFLRDGFSFFAFLVPPLWLLWHRLWLEAAVAIAALVGIACLERLAGFAYAASLLSLLVSMFVGLEGNVMRAAALRRRGWLSRGVVDAETLDDAETRWAKSTASGDLAVHDRAPIVASANPGAPAPGAAVGLLLNPGH